jgi:hypothetical protein
MVWSNGAFVVKDGVGTNPPHFYVLNRDGHWTTHVEMISPDDLPQYTHGFGRLPNGTIVVAGSSELGYRSYSPYLAWIAEDGKTQRIVRTAPYQPELVAAAADGTVWTIGREMVHPDPTLLATNPDEHVLRHFDKNGELIESALPESQFKGLARLRLSSGHLAATTDRLGWYGGVGLGQYGEIDTASLTLTEYPGVAANGKNVFLVTSFALTESGAAVAVVDYSGRNPQVTYALDRSTQSWVPIAVPRLGQSRYRADLLGSDGDTVVFRASEEAGFYRLVR